MGYNELSLGVGPDAARNIEIYFHLGYKDYIKTTIEHDPPKMNLIFQKTNIVIFIKNVYK